jgi:WhiB family redox-sensing transcriptional regulator
MKAARVRHGASANIESSLPLSMRWMARGKCLRVGLEKMFLQGRPTQEDYQRAKDTYCAPCPVRGDCLHWIMMYEIKDKYVSQGIWGGMTPDERRKLRRRIAETGICITDTIRRWVRYGASYHPDTLPTARYAVRVVDNATKQIVFDGLANQDRGSHIVAVREMHRHGKPATAYITDKVEGTMETLESANYREKRQRNPSPEQ